MSEKDYYQYEAVKDDTIELARQLYKDTISANGTDNPLVEQGEDLHFTSILDLACGPGGWIMEVARLLPDTQVMGVDINPHMTDYGRATAKARGLNNVHFMTMDILKPLTFASNTFDLVSARSLVAVISPNAWPDTLRETYRICQPGGIMRLFEVEMALTNSLAFEQAAQMILNALVIAGINFNPTARSFGITAVLPKLLRDAGYVDVCQQAYSTNIFFHSEGHESFCQNYMIAFQMAKADLVQLGLTTAQKYDDLCQQIMQEMRTEEFCAIEYKLCAWGKKPHS